MATGDHTRADPRRGGALALAAFSSLSVADAFTKSLGGRVALPFIGLAIAVLGFLVAPLFKKRGQS